MQWYNILLYCMQILKCPASEFKCVLLNKYVGVHKEDYHRTL